MYPNERIEGLRALSERQQRLRLDVIDHTEEATAFVEAGRQDEEQARVLLERLGQLQAERAAIKRELAVVDPVFTAGMN
jgi:hypothetical protein